MHNLGVTFVAFLALLSLGVSAQPAASAASNASATEPVCFNYPAVMALVEYPPEAIAQNLKEGSALIEFTLTASGKVTNVRAIESSHPIFAAAAESIVAKYQCRGLGKSIQVRVPFQYRTEE